MRLKWSLNSSHPGFISRSFSALGAVALSAICSKCKSTCELASQRYSIGRNGAGFNALWAVLVLGPASSL